MSAAYSPTCHDTPRQNGVVNAWRMNGYCSGGESEGRGAVTFETFEASRAEARATRMVMMIWSYDAATARVVW